MFERHGLKVFFVARFLVALRSPVYLTAGILRVSFRRFLVIDLICASAVVCTVFGLAYYFGDDIRKLIHKTQVLGTIAAVLAVAAVAFYLWRRYQHRHGLVNRPCTEKRTRHHRSPTRRRRSQTRRQRKSRPNRDAFPSHRVAILEWGADCQSAVIPAGWQPARVGRLGASGAALPGWPCRCCGCAAQPRWSGPKVRS